MQINGIGETGQYQKKRDQGHKADIKQGKKSNSFFLHLNKNKNHQIDWETTKILDKEKDYHRSQRITIHECIQKFNTDEFRGWKNNTSNLETI